MLDKRKLKLLEVETFPSVIETSQIEDSEELKYTFTAKKHTVGKEKILTATFFSLDKKTANFRIFFDRKAFVMQWLIPEPKWGSATLQWIGDWKGGDTVCANEQSARIIRSFFRADSEVSPYEVMRDFQKNIRKQQLAARHKIITDEIDERMKTVGRLPRDFEHWLNEIVFDFSRFIYYKRKSKRLIAGFCTSCLKPVEFRITKEIPQENVRHNQWGDCPLCKKSIIFKAEGLTKNLVNHAKAAIMQKTSTGFLIRYFRVDKQYNRHYKNPKIIIKELVRDFYDGREITCYEYTDFKQTKKIRWCNSRNKFRLDVACLYSRNIRAVLADTELKYSCLYELAKNIGKFNIYRYLNAYICYPAYEYLVKLRLYKFVAGNISTGDRNYAKLNFNGKGYQDILGISRTQLQQMQRINGTVEHYQLIKCVGKIGVTLTDEQVEILLDMEIHNSRIVELLEFVTPQKLINYINVCLKTWKPRKECFSRNPTDVSNYWNDYLQNCALLGYDMKSDFILFPRNLKARHDEVMTLYKAEKSEILDKLIAVLHETLQARYSFAWQGMFLRPPISTDEIIADGHALRHCAGTGSYVENMARGKCAILFVRRVDQPDKPFFTMELRDNMVIQCRGKKNCGMTDEVKKFITQFKNKKLKQNIKR